MHLCPVGISSCLERFRTCCPNLSNIKGTTKAVALFIVGILCTFGFGVSNPLFFIPCVIIGNICKERIRYGSDQLDSSWKSLDLKNKTACIALGTILTILAGPHRLLLWGAIGYGLWLGAAYNPDPNRTHVIPQTYNFNTQNNVTNNIITPELSITFSGSASEQASFQNNTPQYERL